MNRRSSPLPLIVAVAGLAALPVVVAQDARPRPAPTDVVATVGDSPIFRSELDVVVRRAAGGNAVAAEVAAPVGSQTSRQHLLEATALEQLVDQRLLRSEIVRERITVGRLDVDMRLEQLKKQVAARGMDWQRFLDQTGRAESMVREQIELEIALDRLIRPKLTAAVIAAGEERHKRSIDGTRMRVSHIVLRPDAVWGDEGLAATKTRAAAIRREILQGATTFAEAARRHSAGPSRLNGGDLGWIKRDVPFIDAFTKQAFELAKGDISKPFVTPFGVHIVQVTDIEPGRVPLEALRPKLEILVGGDLLRETLARLRARTPVTYGSRVAHFDPATPADGDAPRRVVFGE